MTLAPMPPEVSCGKIGCHCAERARDYDCQVYTCEACRRARRAVEVQDWQALRGQAVPPCETCGAARVRVLDRPCGACARCWGTVGVRFDLRSGAMGLLLCTTCEPLHFDERLPALDGKGPCEPGQSVDRRLCDLFDELERRRRATEVKVEIVGEESDGPLAMAKLFVNGFGVAQWPAFVEHRKTGASGTDYAREVARSLRKALASGPAGPADGRPPPDPTVFACWHKPGPPGRSNPLAWVCDHCGRQLGDHDVRTGRCPARVFAPTEGDPRACRGCGAAWEAHRLYGRERRCPGPAGHDLDAPCPQCGARMGAHRVGDGIEVPGCPDRVEGCA